MISSVHANSILFFWTNVSSEGAPPYFKIHTQIKFLASPVKVQAQTVNTVQADVNCPFHIHFAKRRTIQNPSHIPLYNSNKQLEKW